MKSSKIPIRAVLFDMGNVLLYFNAYRAARKFSKNCKVPMHKVWVHFFISSVEKDYTRGKLTTYEFYRHSKKVLKTPVSFKTFKHYWNNIFWENRTIRPILKALKKKYPLYLISNTNAMHFDYIKKKFTILKFFKRTFPSHKMGYRKPEKEIFLKVLKAIRLRPEETVFVDDVKAFGNAAKAVGMKAVQFRNNQQLKRDLKKLGVKL